MTDSRYRASAVEREISNTIFPPVDQSGRLDYEHYVEKFIPIDSFFSPLIISNEISRALKMNVYKNIYICGGESCR